MTASGRATTRVPANARTTGAASAFACAPVAASASASASAFASASGAAAAPAPRRIVSLVPNATEIVFALGAGELLAGVTHECDHPPAARALPRLTRSALAPGLAAADVDAAVRAQLATGASLYALDVELLARLAPDLLLTQELCPVCAVSTAQVEAALDVVRSGAARCPQVLSLDPQRLADIFDDVRRLGALLGREAAADGLLATLHARLDAVRARAALRGAERPRVLALEWLEPAYVAGHWVPEMIDIAGGEAVLAAAGARSRRVEWQEVAAADPDWILAVPCGFDAAGAAGEVARLDAHAWRSLRAVREGRVAPLDANGCWSRPGPRVVDGVEALAALLDGAT